jgi:hypothetical protein
MARRRAGHPDATRTAPVVRAFFLSTRRLAALVWVARPPVRAKRGRRTSFHARATTAKSGARRFFTHAPPLNLPPEPAIPSRMQRAGVAELVDATDLKSVGPKGLCRFESGRPHHRPCRDAVEGYFAIGAGHLRRPAQPVRVSRIRRPAVPQSSTSSKIALLSADVAEGATSSPVGIDDCQAVEDGSSFSL